MVWAVCVFALDGDWHFLNSTSDVRDMDYYNGTLYCATSGGLLCVDVNTGEQKRYTLSDGLGGTGISVLVVDHENGKVYLGMDNLNITVYDHGSFRVYTDFKSEENVIFNKFYVHKGTLLIATNEGISFFAEDDGAMAFGTFKMFGDATNPYHEDKFFEERNIRDVTVVNDTIYILTKYFWAKMKIDWRKPLLSYNSSIKNRYPSSWITNAAEGDFVYRINNSDGTYDTVGYNRFAVTPSGIKGLTDFESFEEGNGAVFSMKIINDSLSRPRNIFITCEARGQSSRFNQGDTFSYPLFYPTFIRYNCMAIDDQGRIYIGTSGRGAYRASDNKSFWNGDDQIMSDFKKLCTDSYGNVYASNIDNPSAEYSNSVNSGEYRNIPTTEYGPACLQALTRQFITPG